MISIELLGLPIGKGRPRFIRATGHAYTPAKTKAYEENLAAAAGRAMAGRSPLEGPLVVFVWATFPAPQSWSAKKRAAALAGTILPTTKPDADNLLKCLDSCNNIVWRDDKQIVDAHISKIYGERPSVVVNVFTVAELHDDYFQARRHRAADYLRLRPHPR